MSSEDTPFGPAPPHWLETAEHGKPFVVIDLNIPTGPDADPLAARLLDVAREAIGPRFDDAEIAEKLSLGEAVYWFRMMGKNRGPARDAFGLNENTVKSAVVYWQWFQHNQEDIAADLRAEFLRVSKTKGFR